MLQNTPAFVILKLVVESRSGAEQLTETADTAQWCRGRQCTEGRTAIATTMASAIYNIKGGQFNYSTVILFCRKRLRYNREMNVKCCARIHRVKNVRTKSHENTGIRKTFDCASLTSGVKLLPCSFAKPESRLCSCIYHILQLLRTVKRSS
jgi:hypothetical protein